MERNLAEVTLAPIRGELEERRAISPWQVLLVGAICVTITACEYVFAFQNVAFGIVFSLVLAIGIYLTLSIPRLDQRISNCCETLALIPLYILFTSSLPWFLIGQQYLLPAVYSCILGLCLWHFYQKNLSLKEIFGFSRRNLLKYSLIGIAVGYPTGIMEYMILHPAPAFPAFEVKYLLRDMAYMLLFVGVGEELLFRGFIQRDLVTAFGWQWGLFGASAIFAVMHFTWRSIPEIGFVFMAGLILGILYLKTKSLVAPIVAHGVNNVVLVAILPYVLMK
jgi:membrane protease YdiL (CAAX protease family)